MAAYFLDTDNSIREFTDAEIDAIEIETYGIKGGTHPIHSRELDASTIQAEYVIKFDMFERFCAFMLGAQVLYEDLGVQLLSRLPPQTWPGKDSFAAVKIPQGRPHKFVEDDTTSKDYPVPESDRMKVNVLFQHVPFTISTDDLTSHERNRYVQILPSIHEVSYLNLPGGIMRFFRASGTDSPHGKQIPYSVGFPVPMSTISRKWIRLPYDVWTEGSPLYERVFGDREGSEKPYTGTINSNTFMGYPPGYLLYLGLEEELQLDPLGDELVWNLTHKWLVSHLAPHTWKYWFSVTSADSANNGWYFTAKDGSGYFSSNTLPDDTALFNSRDHANLLKVG